MSDVVPELSFKNIQSSENQSPVLPIRIPERLIAESQSEKGLQGYNETLPPIPNENSIVRLAEVAKVHREFAADIICRQQADLILCTGSTADVVHDQLLVAIHMDKQTGTIDMKTHLPGIADWESSNYFGGRDSSGPNSIVYKHLDRSTVLHAKENIEDAMKLPEWQQNFSSRQEVNKDSPVHKQLVNSMVHEIVESDKIPTWDHQTQYETLLLFRSLSPEQIQEFQNGLSGDEVMKLKAWSRLMEQLFQPVEKLHQHFDDELGDLQTKTATLLHDIDQRKFKEHEVDTIFRGKRKTYGITDRPDERVALMKALYPDEVTSLFTQDGTPKKIAMYDTVAQSGEKFRNYEAFFKALDPRFADNLEIYTIFARPGYQHTSDLSVSLHVGISTNADFMYASPDEFVGKAHDRAAEFAQLRFPYDKSPKSLSELRAYAMTRMRSIYDQMRLPEAINELHSKTQEINDAEAQGRVEQDRALASLVLEWSKEEPLSRVFSDSSKNYTPDQYEKFEQSFYIGDTKKQLFTLSADTLVQVDSLMTKQSYDRVCLAVADENVYLALSALLERDDCKDLREKVTIELADPFLSDKVSFPQDVPLIFISSDVPTKERLDGYAERNQVAFSHVISLDDSRKYFTEESRKERSNKVLQKIGYSYDQFHSLIDEEIPKLDNDIAQFQEDDYMAAYYWKKLTPEALQTMQPVLERLLGPAVGQDFRQRLENIRDTLQSSSDISDVYTSPEFQELKKDGADLYDYYKKTALELDSLLSVSRTIGEGSSDVISSVTKWKYSVESTVQRLQDIHFLMGDGELIMRPRSYLNASYQFDQLRKYLQELDFIDTQDFEEVYPQNLQIISDKKGNFRYHYTLIDRVSNGASPVEKTVSMVRAAERVRYLRDITSVRLEETTANEEELVA